MGKNLWIFLSQFLVLGTFLWDTLYLLGKMHKNQPNIRNLDKQGKMSSLLMSSTKWNFPWFISEAWLLEKWTSGKRKKSKTENESQSEKNRHTHTRNIINSCLFTERKSLKSRKKLPTLDECYKLLEHVYLYLHSSNRFLN